MQKLFHFHIPKTGGTAIRHYVAKQVGLDHVSPAVVGLRVNDALLRWGNFDVISGHFIAHQGDRLPSDRCGIVVLRNPIDRFLSEYSYSRIDNADRLLNAKVHALELGAYLESLSPKQIEAFSLQIEILYAFGTSAQTTLSADEKLAAAMRALEQFQLVGTQDELEDFICMLDAKFSWSPAPLALKNVTSRRILADELPPEQIRKLRHLLESEFEFYHQAKARFKRDRRSFIRSVPAIPEPAKCIGVATSEAAAHTAQTQEFSEFGDRRCVARRTSVAGKVSGNALVMTGEELTISIDLVANERIDELNIGIAIKDEQGLLIFGTNSMLLGHIYSLTPGEYTVQFSMLNRAPLGKYRVDIALVRSETHYQGCYHWLEGATSFEVHEKAISHFEGHILMDADIEVSAFTTGACWTHTPYISTGHQVRSFGRINRPLNQFSSTIEPLCNIGQLYAGTDAFLPMRVKNIGGEAWPASGQQPVMLSYRWITLENQVIVADGLRTRLPSDLRPGTSVIVPLQVRTPSDQGNFELVVSLVQEAVAWFVDKNPASGFSNVTNIQDSIQTAS